MPKRKLDNLDGQRSDDPALGGGESRAQRQQLEGFLELGKKALFRALKVARGFERQKLGRRQKTAKKDGQDADLTRLTAEVAALKVVMYANRIRLKLTKTAEPRPCFYGRDTSLQIRPEDQVHCNLPIASSICTRKRQIVPENA